MLVPGNKIIITTDASSKGLGAVLSQEVNEGEKTIAFAYRLLPGGEELHYLVMDKEALAVFWAVKKFRNFVWTNIFKIRTDHKPLKEIFERKGLDSSLTASGDWSLICKNSLLL